MHPDPIAVKDFKTYLQKMSEASVIVDPVGKEEKNRRGDDPGRSQSFREGLKG